MIWLVNRYYQAHRVAWFLVHGRWPKAELDHINGVRDDNRLSNLREASRSQNARNTSSRRGVSSQYKGVYYVARGDKWAANIFNGKKSSYLGWFDKEEDAAAAYDREARALYGEFAKLNFP